MFFEGITVRASRGEREESQDVFAFSYPNLGKLFSGIPQIRGDISYDAPYLIAALCDGHGSQGREVAEKAATGIVTKINEQLEKGSAFSEQDLAEIISTEHALLLRERAELDWDRNTGTTLDVAVLQNDGRYLFGHVGDGEVLLVSPLSVESLTSVQIGYFTTDERPDPMNYEWQVGHYQSGVGPDSVGQTVRPDIQVGSGTLNDERLVLWTDGAWGLIHREELRKDIFDGSTSSEIMGRLNHPDRVLDIYLRVAEISAEQVNNDIVGQDDASMIILGRKRE